MLEVGNKMGLTVGEQINNKGSYLDLPLSGSLMLQDLCKESMAIKPLEVMPS